MTPIDTGALAAIPWKNGGGLTRTLAVEPEGAGFDDFLWRVSIADVTAPGRFSNFPGVDRIIVLLEGQGMILHEDGGGSFALTDAFVPHAFSGEARIDAALVRGPSRDFNVMVRRGRARASVRVWRANSVTGDDWPNLPALYFCARGRFRAGPAVLESGHALKTSTGINPILPESADAVLIGVAIEMLEAR